MRILIIVAMDENRGIGKDNKIPWKIVVDMKRFKELTMGHHVIMGRNTFESIGKPLPGRITIVLTRSPNWTPGSDSCFVCSSLQHALNTAEKHGQKEVFICGGMEVYAETLKICKKGDRLYITLVHAMVEADTFFPKFDESLWRRESLYDHKSADEKNQYASTFYVLKKT